MKVQFCFATALLCTLVSAANSTIACYSTINYVVNVGANVQQTPQLCLQNCQSDGYGKYIALYKGNQCFCLENAPTFGEEGSANCNVACVGDSSTFCGGVAAYNVYSSDQVVISSSTSSSSSSSVVSSSTSANSTTSSSTTSAASSSTAASSATSTSASSSSKGAAAVAYAAPIEGLFGLVASYLLL